MASPTVDHPGPDLTAEDMVILQSFPKNSTKKNTQWTLSLWNTWRISVNDELEDTEKVPNFFHLLSLPHVKIDKSLARFITDLKRPNGEDFPFDSVRAVIFGAQRYARAYAKTHKRQTMIFLGDEYLFPEFNKAFIEKKSSLAQQSTNRKHEQNRPEGLSVEKEKALWDGNIFGCHSAQALSDTIYFYLIKVFGLVSGLALRLLKTEHFVFSEDEHGKYVEIDKHYAKDLDPHETIFNRCHGIETVQTGKLRHYCDPNNPRSFYHLLRRYLNELKHAPTDDTTLLLTPKQGMRFSAHPLGRNNLQKNFNRIMNSANLKGYYTNLSFVQSVAQRLLASGYNIRKQRCFKSSDHLQICKILDPPAGNTITEAFTSQTRAIYQLGTLQNTQQYATLPFCCANVSVSSGNPVLVKADHSSLSGLPSSMQVVQPLDNTNILTYNKIALPTVLPESSSLASSLATKDLIPVPGSLFLRSGVSSNASETAFTSAMSSVSAQSSADSSKGFRNATGTVACGEATDESEAQKEQVPLYPLYMSTASVQDEGEDLSSTVIIKQEPVDTEYNSADKIDNHVVDQIELNQANSVDNPALRMALNSSLRKRKLVKGGTKETATKGQNVKMMCQDHPCSSREVDNISAVHNVDIEYSYSHDVDKNSVKQEVAVNDDDQTVFSFTGSTRFGKTASDLELCLGDYLPDDCYIKVSDIKLKRIVTPDGGKMVFQFKYSPKT